MKKFNKFGYAGAIALATAMSFSACSSDDEMENINPTFNGSSVKTQFAVSLTQKANKGGRMATQEALPGDGSNVAEFYGLTGMRLYQFKGAVAEGTSFDESITLAEASSFANSSLKNALIYDIQIPVGVKNFLFYGENKADGVTNEYKQAKIKATWAGEDQNPQTVGTTKFAPYTILSDAQGWDGNNGAVANIETILNTLHGYLTADGVKEYLTVETAALEALNTASSEHILVLMNRIYNSIEEQIAVIDDATLEEKIQGVLTNIQTYFDYADGKLTWKEAKNPQFPTKFNLPAGAVAVDYKTKEGKLAFYVLEVSSITADGAAEATIADYTKFAYPPTLMYFANSPARTSNIPYLKNTALTTWADFVAQYAQNEVTSTTQSVVLKNQVNFGMAQLKTKVNFAAGDIKDNAVNGGTNVDVTTNPFTVTGILVGNQQGVKWDFTHDDESEVYTVYDRVMTSAMTTSSNAYNYTTVFESKPGTDVLVAVELVNNSGSDFVGVGGQIVAAGAKFYLVGKLEVASGNKPVVNGQTVDIDKVFQQDFVTTANLTISSLKNAYNVIPDLETPEMEFGLSVDLSWQTGLTFNVTIQ